MATELILGLSPFDTPDAGLIAAVCKAGAIGVLDLGRARAAGLDALATVERSLGRAKDRLGVRVSEGAPFAPADVPRSVALVVLEDARELAAWRAPSTTRRVLVQVTDVEQARAAFAAGADGLIAKGNESGGRGGEETSFLLLQRLVANFPEAPIWVQGGVGLHTAAACVAGGARGVVLDAQLALVEESQLPKAIRDVVRSLDGGETAVVAGYRVLVRPDLAAAPVGASAAEVVTRLGARDLKTELLAAGQDAAFARPLADRFKTAAGVVRAITRAVSGHLRQARELDPLAPGSPLAVDLDVRYPIAQGPMTRVSDRAAFADAVSTAGALPFLALSLMRGAEARALLEAVKSQHEGRSWGVGILGFVSPDLRDEQLALIRELRPPVALIAGGRPSQSQPLEDLGVRTFLHVPSPGLLDLFLGDGARRFVLEGRECGGHVGPRSSFVLWEAAIERLLDEPQLADCSVLFAGGIHDARSAAMVAAAAAPLAARGCKIGVLMGTAYLFTTEAVATGAIQPAFQDVALACDRTVLLDTAPGHSTRCAETDYVRAFRDERARLEAAGTGAKEMWEELERLNLGRLRIAAKGLARGAAGLADVDDATQRSEGMFMLGQVAALRHAVCTIAELHADVSSGSRAILAATEPTLPTPAMEIAIVGMAAIFPGAPDLPSYWRNILTSVNAITEVPRARWNPEQYFDPAGTGDKTPSRWGGFLSDVAFDPAAYGIPPRSLAAIEPTQLLALEVSRRALDDAGYGAGATKDFDRERASVIFGAESGTDLSGAYGFRALHRQYLGELPAALDAALPKLTEDSFPGVLSNVIAGRIANRLDLGGVNFTVDAACASSLAAVDLACQSLASGQSDLVICGGADLHNGINDYLMFASVHALSPTGQCRPFDAGADGIVLGEGVAALVLKRRADAERDGDRVYAIIKGVGGSSDGKSLGLTAPRPEGQTRALERAYARAGVSPADVELLEAHGTGTVVGDRTELTVLGEVFGGAGALPGHITLGSVKSQIGHTKCAAGLAGLIKTALAIHHRVLPPTGNLKKLNPAYEGAKSPFVFRDAAHPWPSARRLAGVSAFGFGGTNFHVVLEGVSDEASGFDAWPAELFVVRAASDGEARAALAALGKLAASGKPYRLRDLAAGCSGTGPVRAAFVADSLEDLATKCASATVGAAALDGRVAMLFPGQGSQRPGMLADLLVAFPEIQASLAAAPRFAGRMYPSAALSPLERGAQAAALTDTRVAQPALGIADLALAQLLASVGVEGELLGGHSYGELVALVVGGALDARDLPALSERRARCILDAAAGAPGSMAAVRASVAEVEAALGEGSGVVLANRNAPDQVVIAGPDEAVAAASARLNAAGLSCKKLPVACAFHSPVVARGAATFARHLDGVAVHAPVKTVFANSSAAPYPAAPSDIRALLAGQIAAPVRFADEIEAMYAAGARVFVEAGPGGVLTNLVDRVLGDRPHLAVACDRAGEPGLPVFLEALAALALAGVPVDTAPLFAHRDVRPIDPKSPPVVDPPATAWLVDGQHARPLHGEPPDFAMRPILEPILVGVAVAASSPQLEREATVVEYLRGMRELVENQKLVMLRYLGESVPTQPRALPPAPKPATAPASAPAPDLTPAPVVTKQPPLEVLIGIVSERTGYPKDMLDPDLDLEADLGIDSIKRIEILGTLAGKLGLQKAAAGKRSEMIEELSRVKTLRAIAAWVESRNPDTATQSARNPDTATESARNPDTATESAAPPSAPIPEPIRDLPSLSRYVLAVEPIGPARANGLVLDGRTFLITDDGHGVAPRLAALLVARGAHARLHDGASFQKLDGLIHLAPLAAQSDGRALFALAKQAVLAGATWIFAATRAGNDAFGHVPKAAKSGRTATGSGGVAGLLKSVAKEWPALRVRNLDLDLEHDASDAALDAAAVALMTEVLSDDPTVEVGYRDGVRHRLVPVATPVAPAGAADLSRDAVVLITGGARGITAAAALELARRFGCALEIVGRSPAPPDETFAAATDAPALRRAIIEHAGATRLAPAAIEAQVTRLLADREMRRTLGELHTILGTRVRYHAVDVRDRAAFGAVIDDIYVRHGRLDGVIHGAGVIEDRLLRDKTPESFDRVFDTKVGGALTLVDKLHDKLDGLRFVAFFSSISGAFGNRGQVDYAAANDALDKLAHTLRRSTAGHVVSINWGPWLGAGMLSPELEREYERRGIGLIRPEEGVAHLIDELLHGTSAQVILMSGTPEQPMSASERDDREEASRV